MGDVGHFNVLLELLWRAESQDGTSKPLLLKRKENWSGLKPTSVCLPPQNLTTRPNRLTACVVLFCVLFYAWLTECERVLLRCWCVAVGGDAGPEHTAGSSAGLDELPPAVWRHHIHLPAAHGALFTFCTAHTALSFLRLFFFSFFSVLFLKLSSHEFPQVLWLGNFV